MELGLPGSAVEQWKKRDWPAAPDRRRCNAVNEGPASHDEAGSQGAAMCDSHETELATGGQYAARIEENGLDGRGAQEVQDVRREEAVGGGVAEGEVRTRGRLHDHCAVCEWTQAGASKADHSGAEIGPVVTGAWSKRTPQQGLGQAPGAAAEFEDKPRGLEGCMRDEEGKCMVFIEALRVLLAAKAVVERLGPFWGENLWHTARLSPPSNDLSSPHRPERRMSILSPIRIVSKSSGPWSGPRYVLRVWAITFSVLGACE